ncbi:hypothetical protein CRENBAI_002912 [Crenichthys baileyi]|uniref:Uncharacterized protein n=1 Tax=Crenichthys baileyi TaxID=28760 RepID=A0AAV9S2Q4_9TELE
MLAWSGSQLSNCRGGGVHVHWCGSCSGVSHAFVCHSTVSQFRYNSAHVIFTLSSPTFCCNARRTGGVVEVFCMPNQELQEDQSPASPPELKEKVREPEENSPAAVRQFYCRPPPSASCLQSAAAQPTSSLQNGAAAQPSACLQSTAAAQPTPVLQRGAAVQPTPGLQSAAAKSTPGLQNAAAQPTSASLLGPSHRGSGRLLVMLVSLTLQLQYLLLVGLMPQPLLQLLWGSRWPLEGWKTSKPKLWVPRPSRGSGKDWYSSWSLNPVTRGLRTKCCVILFLSDSRSKRCLILFLSSLRMNCCVILFLVSLLGVLPTSALLQPLRVQPALLQPPRVQPALLHVPRVRQAPSLPPRVR